MIDVIAILDHESYEVLFEGANIMSLDVSDEKQVTKFQVEDGSSRSDHVVSLPVLARMRMEITENTKPVFSRLQQAYNDNRLLIVQSRVASYRPMLIETFPHYESVDNINGVTLDIGLTEWRTVAPVYGDMPLGTTRNPAQSSTIKRGQQQTSETDGSAARRKGSVLSGVFS